MCHPCVPSYSHAPVLFSVLLSCSRVRMQAKKVLQLSEAQARNALTVQYDDTGAFHLCAGSLTPIPRGAAAIRSPYSGAYYTPEFKGSVCVIDGMAKVGVETLGLVSFNTTAASGARSGGR